MVYLNIFRYHKIQKWISHSQKSLVKYNFLWLLVNILEYFLIHVYPRRLIFQVLKLTSKDVAFYCSNFVGKLHGFLLFMAIQFVKVWCKAVHFRRSVASMKQNELQNTKCFCAWKRKERQQVFHADRVNF